MFLIEPERGCSRGCTYCVMRRSTNGGMRTVSRSASSSCIPATAKRVGLVGAAVTDHPRLPDILRARRRRRQQVGISSLRPIASTRRSSVCSSGPVSHAHHGGRRRLREVAAALDRKTKEAQLVRSHSSRARRAWRTSSFT